MARYRFQSREWLVERIKRLEDQLASGLKSISTGDGSTSFVGRDEAERILDELYAAVADKDGSDNPDRAVFRAYRLMQRHQ
ncbi:hypothetical protein [Devosia nitrariae]|uniref:Uncharacterized protein n=1 Tax=Devosia nitrariae TaxID=2071872 RepID=A0ABQ5W1R0_9HYPH|nr:hypothetical protein [Devosia nitrariae]GLQ53605.1 hypothetical protein GCM10010862_08640 [Devosia nitrariae]